MIIKTIATISILNQFIEEIPQINKYFTMKNIFKVSFCILLFFQPIFGGTFKEFLSSRKRYTTRGSRIAGKHEILRYEASTHDL